MDNESNDSDQEVDIGTSQTKKPNNRNRFYHNGLVVSSEFSGGNISAALFQQQFRISGKNALVIQFWGNSDAQSDPLDKSWFYFLVSGISQAHQLNYEQIIFRFKNANIYRKFIRQKRYNPYVMVRESLALKKEDWRAILVSKLNILQNQIIQSEFVYTIKPGVDLVEFAQNLPYCLVNLKALDLSIKQFISETKSSSVYYHLQTITHSVDDHPIYMCTITSNLNIANYHQKQSSFVGIDASQPPLMLKSRPEIVITARVHPSETSSSFCVEGIIQNLVKNLKFQILTNFFIFRVIPMLNPDGVENGHYRLDNYLQNLNRFYGHSDVSKTPSIYAVQKILASLREKSKLFLFLDIHGHNSPKPSFIFGNFSQNFNQVLENKTFVKVMELLNEGIFDAYGCEFSKRNMTVKQKYDEHSKQASARVFAYRGNSQEDNGQIQSKTTIFVEHSYTLEIHPYIAQENRKNVAKKSSKQVSYSYKNLPKLVQTVKKTDFVLPQRELYETEIVDQYKRIGQNFLTTILHILGATSRPKYEQIDDVEIIRKRTCRELTKQLEFYDRSKKIRYKQINHEILERYYQKWNFLQLYRLFLSINPSENDLVLKYKDCPMHEFYEEARKKDRSEDAKRPNLLARQFKDKLGFNLNSAAEKLQNQQQKFEEISPEKNTKASDKQETKKFAALKTIEFQIESESAKHIQNRNSSEIKKQKNIEPSQIQILQRKIRKLMFRHRTETQSAGGEDQGLIDQVSASIFWHKTMENEVTQAKYKNQKLLKQTQSKLQPLSKHKNTKASHIKTEGARTKLQFSDQKLVECKNVGSFEKVEGLPKKDDRFDKLHSRIEQFVKKLSVQKLQFDAMSQNEQIKKNEQLHSQSKMCISNKIVSTTKKPETRIKAWNSESEKNYVAIYSTINHQSRNTTSEQKPIIMKQETLIHQRNRSKPRYTQKAIRNNFEQSHEAVRSFRIVAAGEASIRQQFLHKAKKIISQKRKDLEGLEHKKRPFISDLEQNNGGS